MTQKQQNQIDYAYRLHKRRTRNRTPFVFRIPGTSNVATRTEADRQRFLRARWMAGHPYPGVPYRDTQATFAVSLGERIRLQGV